MNTLSTSTPRIHPRILIGTISMVLFFVAVPAAHATWCPWADNSACVPDSWNVNCVVYTTFDCSAGDADPARSDALVLSNWTYNWQGNQSQNLIVRQDDYVTLYWKYPGSSTISNSCVASGYSDQTGKEYIYDWQVALGGCSWTCWSACTSRDSDPAGTCLEYGPVCSGSCSNAEHTQEDSIDADTRTPGIQNFSYSCPDGTTNSATLTVLGPTASFTSTPSCSIPGGSATCSSPVSWTSSNVDGVNLTDCSGVVSATTGYGPQTSNVNIPYNSGCYQIRNPSPPDPVLVHSPVLAQTSGSSACAAGASWNGSVCFNSPPIASAGPDAPITLPTTSYSIPAGAASASDPGGSVASTVWSFVSGPAAATVSSGGSTLTPTFSNMTVVGAYTFRLTVTDNGGATATDNMIVNVAAAALPDLVVSADPVLAGSYANGVTVTFTATIKNQGGATAVAPFNNIFQFDNDANHNTTWATTTVATASNLAASATALVTTSRSFGSNGTYYVRVCTDENASMVGTVIESNEGNNCGNWIPIIIANPNLTFVAPGTVSPTAATAGIATLFAMQIKNNGATSTVTSFTNALQKANDAVGTGAAYVAINTAGPLATSSQTAGFSISYAFPLGDGGTTKYLRICADRNLSGVGTIAETSETDANNCGGWTAVAVAAAASPPPTCPTFTVPSTVNINTQTTVTWSCQDANPNSCTQLGNPDGFATGGSNAGSDATVPLTTAGPHAPYGIHCIGPGGAADLYSNSFTVVDSTTAKITASPPVINPGGTTSITATCTSIPGGTAEVDGPIALYPPSGIVTGPTLVGASGNYSYTFTTPAINNQSIFTVTCTPASGLGSPADSSVTIKFKPIFNPF
jgi:plastocyanin